jgi:hypothetical protein
MDYDMNIKAKVGTNGESVDDGQCIDLKHFVALTNVDKDIIVDKITMEKVINLSNLKNRMLILNQNLMWRKEKK